MKDKNIFSFAGAYKKMHVHSFLNDDMTIINKMSAFFLSEYENDCKTKGYYSFNPQVCFNKCHKEHKTKDSMFQIGVSKEKRMHDLCLSACSFLDTKITTFHEAHYDTYLNEVLRNEQCNQDYIGVSNNNRSNINKKLDNISNDASDIVNEVRNR
ncbi:MAG: hypothetical protein GY909_09505 [Oligoflexia bacterium]|nr:hypothetical protein [Oligoflexia bacterium]